MPCPPRPCTTWVKSSRSAGGNECVEIARLPERMIGVRDSKAARPGGVLAFQPCLWARFLTETKNGLHDLL